MPVAPIIPPEWPLVYTVVVGQNWPQADEDAVRRCAQAWTDALAGLVAISDGGAQATQNVHYSVQAISTDEFDNYWKQYTTGDDSAVGQLAQQCQVLAEELLSFAEQTEFTKISIDIQIIILMIQLAWELFIAPATGGLSMGAAFASMFVAREVVEGLLFKLIDAVIMAVLPDLITQAIMVADGHRSQIDWGEVGQSAQMGLIGGLVGAGAGKLLGNTLENRLGKEVGGLLNAGLHGALTNVGTNAVVSMVDTVENPDTQGTAGEKSKENPLAAIANGAFTGMLFHGIHEATQKPAVTFTTGHGTFTGVRTGENSYTLFSEDKYLPGTQDKNPDYGKLRLATLDDNGKLQLSSPLGGTTETTPTHLQETSHGTTTYSQLTNGQQTLVKTERVSDGGPEFTFQQDGQAWTAPRNSVVTFNPDNQPVHVVHPEGDQQAVYAGNGDQRPTLIGHQRQLPGGETTFVTASGQTVSPEQFQSLVSEAQQPPAVPANLTDAPAPVSVPGSSVPAPPEVGAQDTAVLAASGPEEPSVASPAAQPPAVAAPAPPVAGEQAPVPSIAAVLLPEAPKAQAPGGTGPSSTQPRGSGDATVGRTPGQRTEDSATRPGRPRGSNASAPTEPGEENAPTQPGAPGTGAAQAPPRPEERTGPTAPQSEVEPAPYQAGYREQTTRRPRGEPLEVVAGDGPEPVPDQTGAVPAAARPYGAGYPDQSIVDAPVAVEDGTGTPQAAPAPPAPPPPGNEQGQAQLTGNGGGQTQVLAGEQEPATGQGTAGGSTTSAGGSTTSAGGSTTPTGERTEATAQQATARAGSPDEATARPPDPPPGDAQQNTGPPPGPEPLAPRQEYALREVKDALTFAEAYDKRWQELHDQELAALDRAGDPTVRPLERVKAAEEALLARERRAALEDALTTALGGPEDARAAAIRELFGGDARPTPEREALINAAKARGGIIAVRDLGRSAELANEKAHAQNELARARTAAGLRGDLASAHVDSLREGRGGLGGQLDRQLGGGEPRASLRQRVRQVEEEQRRHQAALRAGAEQLANDPQRARAEAQQLRRRPPRRLFPAEEGERPGLAGTTRTVGELSGAAHALAPTRSEHELPGSVHERYDAFRQALSGEGWRIEEKPSRPDLTFKVPWADTSSGLGVVRSLIGGEQLQIKRGQESFEASTPNGQVRVRVVHRWTELQAQSSLGLDTTIASELEPINGGPARSIKLVDLGPPENNFKIEIKFPEGTTVAGPAGKGEKVLHSTVEMEVLHDPYGIVDTVTPRHFRNALDPANENLGTVNEQLGAQISAKYTRQWPGIKIEGSVTVAGKTTRGVELAPEKFAGAASVRDYAEAAIGDRKDKVSVTVQVTASVPGTPISHNAQLTFEGTAKDVGQKVEGLTDLIRGRFQRGQYELDESTIVDALDPPAAEGPGARPGATPERVPPEAGDRARLFDALNVTDPDRPPEEGGQFERLGEQAGGPYWSQPEATPPWQTPPTAEEIAQEQATADLREREFLDGLDPVRRHLFEQVRDQVVNNDRRVRQDLTSAFGTDNPHGGDLVGTENFRKRSPSIDEKIDKLSPEQRQAIEALTDNPAELVKTFSGELNDLQRYTATFPAEHYVEGTLAELDALQDKGYRLFDGPGKPARGFFEPDGTLAEGDFVKNFWREGNRYEGLNLTLVDPDGAVFELQFHTPESFRLKQSLTEGMYKIASSGEQAPPRRVNALQELVAVNRKYLGRPPEGIERFGRSKDATFDTLVARVHERATPEERGVLDKMLRAMADPDVALGSPEGREHPYGHLRELPESTVDHRVFEMVPAEGGTPSRVHLERTPSGWSLHTEASVGAESHARARAMAQEAGYLNVVGHATRDGFLADGHVVPFHEVFDRIPLPEGTDLVRLIACDAGGGEAAGRLAREIGRPVVAADRPVWITNNGEVVSASPVDPEHDPYPKRPPDGQWKVFEPPEGEASPLAADDSRLPKAPRGWEPGVAGRRADVLELGRSEGFGRADATEVPTGLIGSDERWAVLYELAGRLEINRGVSVATRVFLRQVSPDEVERGRVGGFGFDEDHLREQRSVFEEVVAKYRNNALFPGGRMRSGETEYSSRGGYRIEESFHAYRGDLAREYEREARQRGWTKVRGGEAAKAFLIRGGHQAVVDRIQRDHALRGVPDLRFSHTEFPGRSHSYEGILQAIENAQYPGGRGHAPAFTDQEVARAVRDLLRQRTPERRRTAVEALAHRIDPSYPGLGRTAGTTPAADTPGGRFAQHVVAVAELVYGLEPARHPEALFTNLMALHLAAEGQLTFADAIAHFNTMHPVGAAQLSDVLDEHLVKSFGPPPAGVDPDDWVAEQLSIGRTERTSGFSAGRLSEQVAEFRRREREIIVRFGMYYGYFSDPASAQQFFGTPGVGDPQLRTRQMVRNLSRLFEDVAREYHWGAPEGPEV